MVAYQHPRKISPEGYLARKREAETRSEYYDGVLYGMAGSSLNHNRIALNTASGLEASAATAGCDTYAMDLRVRLSFTKYAYPDVVVAFGKPETTSDQPPSLLNPRVVVEVLSDSPEPFDRKDKLDYYSALPSFREYLLIAQDRPRVEHHHRDDAGKWTYTVYRSVEDVIHLESVGIELPLAKVYARVQFP